MACWIARLTASVALAGLLPADTKLNREPVHEFNHHIAAYLRLRQLAMRGMPALKSTPSPDVIAARSQQLAARIRARRGKAQPGSIFVPAVRTEFLRLIAITMHGKDATAIRESLAHAEPVTLALHVNDSYPTNVPLQSTPPTLLQNLPQLPKELEYRVVGRALVLRDVEANIIVDFIANALE